MSTLKDVYETHKADSAEVQELCDDIYSEYFGSTFEYAKSLRARFGDTTTVITDSELETIITELPLELVFTADSISKLKLQSESIKFGIKEKEYSAYCMSNETTETKKKEDAAQAVVDDKLLLSVYGIVIARAEKEVSMFRELIMGAKKVWDSRRLAEKAVPVGETDSSDADLPEYNYVDAMRGKTYIK